VLSFEDLGRTARVTVRMEGSLPSELAVKEVMGIGVDLYPEAKGDSESEYQLFADGGSDGWRAYLETPAGFVRYPGDFHLEGNVVQFEVPWSSLGDRPPAAVTLFVDWGKPTLGGVITRTQDLAPDRGRAAVSR
jgi:hypothetical protein